MDSETYCQKLRNLYRPVLPWQQPDHEEPTAYTFIGKPEKRQKIRDDIINNMYGIGDKGLALAGMDDDFELSA